MYTRAQKQSKGVAKILLLVVIGLLVLLSTAQIFLAARVATTGRQIRQLEQKRHELTLQNQRLQAQINQVSSLAYLEKRAREDLGMVNPGGAVEYLHLPAPNYLARR